MTSSSSERVSVAFLILLLGSLAVAGGQVQQCAGFGEYCQNHWDCCSNTCMSYLYRCTRNYDVFPFAFGGAYPPVHSTLEEILDLNFGNSIRTPVEVQIRPVAFYPRFGGADEFSSDFEVVQRDVQQTTTTTEKPVKCQVAEADAVSAEAKKKDEIISAAKATTAATETEDDDTKITTEDVKRSAVTTTTTTEPKTTTSEPTTTTVKSSSAGTTEPRELVSVIRTGPTITTMTSPDTTSTPSTPSTRCSVVGSKCYRNEECCTVRCHGFLHQCVT